MSFFERTYASHGVLDVLDVVEADRAIHEAPGPELGALVALEHRAGVAHERRRREGEADHVHHRVPREHEVGQRPRGERERARGERRAGGSACSGPSRRRRPAAEDGAPGSRPGRRRGGCRR